jgi:hypothetical protein
MDWHITDGGCVPSLSIPGTGARRQREAQRHQASEVSEQSTRIGLQPQLPRCVPCHHPGHSTHPSHAAPEAKLDLLRAASLN